MVTASDKTTMNPTFSNSLIGYEYDLTKTGSNITLVVFMLHMIDTATREGINHF